MAQDPQQEALVNLILHLIRQEIGPQVAPELAQREAQRIARDATRIRLPKPEVFNGGKRLKDAEEWLFVMDTYLTASSVSLDIERITVASGYLRGPALTWWRRISRVGNHDRPTTWHAFCQALLATFQPINPAETARDTLARLRQTTSVRQYASVMRDTALEIPGISDAELKDRFIRGLKAATQTEVRMRTPATFEEAVRVAERYDAIRYRTNHLNAPANPAFGRGGSSGPTPMELGAAIDQRSTQARPNNQRPRLTPVMRQQLIKEGKCFYCRKPGHMALNCPERKKNQA